MKNEEEPENHEPGPKKLGFKTALAHLEIKNSRPGDVDDGNIDEDDDDDDDMIWLSLIKHRSCPRLLKGFLTDLSISEILEMVLWLVMMILTMVIMLLLMMIVMVMEMEIIMMVMVMVVILILLMVDVDGGNGKWWQIIIRNNGKSDNNDDMGNGNNFDLVDVDGGNGKW